MVESALRNVRRRILGAGNPECPAEAPGEPAVPAPGGHVGSTRGDGTPSAPPMAAMPDGPPQTVDPYRVRVHPNPGGGHCLYYALEQAMQRSGAVAVGMLGQRHGLAVWIQAHLDDLMWSSGEGGAVSFREAVGDAVRGGHSESVDAYLRELDAGVDACGRAPYGGVIEISAFVGADPSVRHATPF